MTLKFPDLSHYKTGVDVAKYPALITKACEGTSMVDATYAGYKAAAAKAGIPFLGYHFLKHGAISAQVAHAIAVVGHGQPLMLDVETAGDGTVATLADVYSFADQYKAAGGRVTLAYIPHWYWQGKWHSPSLAGLTQRSIGLISSNYTTYSDGGPGWASYGGVKPVIWQYTSTPMDMNAFKGTQAQLAALFAGTTSTPNLGDDMPTAQDLWNADVIANPSQRADSKTNPTTQADFALGNVWARVCDLQDSVKALTALVSKQSSDAIAAAVVAKLPAGSVTAEQVQAAAEAGVADALSKVSVDVNVAT